MAEATFCIRQMVDAVVCTVFFYFLLFYLKLRKTCIFLIGRTFLSRNKQKEEMYADVIQWNDYDGLFGENTHAIRGFVLRLAISLKIWDDFVSG